MYNIINSPITETFFDNIKFLIKRDDLLHKDFSGNKARKFTYFLDNDFPNIDTIVSYGSNQSNAMYSLSVLAKLKGWNYLYHTNHIPTYLKQNPNGNYKYALTNGMKLISKDELEKYRDSGDNSILFINEGGAVEEAKYGIKLLAYELKEYISTLDKQNIKIFLPSGTGTTALFLQKYLDDIEVQTTPCVGDSEYLKKQFFELEPNLKRYPTIIKPHKKYHFGKLYKENISLWLELKKQTNIEFDLLYDPIGWRVLLDNLEDDMEYIYVHQGGIIGNESMLLRYRYKYKELF